MTEHDGCTGCLHEDKRCDVFPCFLCKGTAAPNTNEYTDRGDYWERKPTPPDAVQHPSHYTQGGIECIEAIKAALGKDGFTDYCRGNVYKYCWRFRDKNGIEDLRKAKVYLEWMIENEEDSNGNTDD